MKLFKMKKNDNQTGQADKTQELSGQIADLNNKYLRALADYQNLDRQTDDWKRSFVQFANLGLIVKLLEVLDDLEKARDTIKDNGLTLVVDKFKKLLENEGLEELELEGKDYDPNLAEVVTMEPGDKNDIIAKVLQKGYKIKDKIIRPGKVIVSKKE